MSIYSFLAGVLTGGAVLAGVVWMWRVRQPSLRQAGLVAAGALLTFALAVTVLYLAIGHRAAPGTPAAHSGTPAPHPVGSAQDGQQAQSMEQATTGLAARLARDGGSDKEWELLAKSYEFMGRPEDAQLAREHKAPPSALAAAGTAGAAPVAPPADAPAQGTDLAAVRVSLERKLKSNPKDVGTLLDLAVLDQEEKAYTKARERYRQVIALKGMTADAWADYADVLAALAGGSLGGESAQAIEHALAINPTNEKALWLKATRAYQERRYADALALWKTLRASLPAGSPDLGGVDSNIAEAQQLAAGTSTGPAPAAAAAPVAVSGTVSIDSRLAGLVASGATLFIYARPADQAGGPPLAVMRTRATGWPVSFRLDDSMAMMPSRRLSQFDKVIIEARVSASGQAAPSPGDLYVTSAVIRPADGNKLTLVISQKIG
jgi:cytochrome c-type biogenesis protein CcmH